MMFLILLHFLLYVVPVLLPLVKDDASHPFNNICILSENASGVVLQTIVSKILIFYFFGQNILADLTIWSIILS